MASLFASSRSDVITAPVRPGKLAVIVKEKGNLESAANKDVHCEVEGGTTIIMIKPILAYSEGSIWNPPGSGIQEWEPLIVVPRGLSTTSSPRRPAA